MSLELKLQSGGNGDKFHLHGGDLQGFVCFTWTSPFQKYVDFCNLIKIQVTLEGYLVTNPSNKLTSGKKFYSSEILCVRGLYGTQKLGQVFPKRSFAFPFIVRPSHAQHMLPTTRSAKMMNVAYRLKTRLILRDHGTQRTPDQSYSSFSHQLPFMMPSCSSPNSSTLEAIQRARRIDPNDINQNDKLVCASTDAFQIQASLSDAVASMTGPAEILLRLDSTQQAVKPVWKITAKLIQECNVEEGVAVRKKVELFHIRVDAGDLKDRRSEDLSIPFNFPDGLLPTLILKDQTRKVSYNVQVTARFCKREECTITLPLIVVL